MNKPENYTVMIKTVYHYFQDFVALFFPDLCAGCQSSLVKHETALCIQCIYHLPRTNFHLDPQNPIARTFWGRFPFTYAGAFTFFQKGNKVQHIMHQLKYNSNTASGFKMGELYGYELTRTNQWQNLDLIIPIPLHPKKLRQRGYNQSLYIAQGLASVLDIPVSVTALERKRHTSTQTKKSRYDRYENLKDAFEIKNSCEVVGKHILLIDDVITTGATLEACATTLLKLESVQISVASIGYVQG